MCRQLRDDIVQVARVRVAVTALVGDARLVVNLVPDDRVRLAGRHRRADGERQSTTPRLGQQRQHLTPTTPVIPRHTIRVISEMFFPANLLASTEESKPNMTKANMHPEHKILLHK